MLLICNVLLIGIEIWWLIIIWLVILIIVIYTYCWSFRFGFGYFSLIFHFFPLLDDLFDPFPVFFKFMYQFSLLILLVRRFFSFSMLFCEISFIIIWRSILLLLNIDHFLAHVDKMLQKIRYFWNVRDYLNLKFRYFELGLYHSE